MRIHEFGDKDKPVILLLPGNMCYWKGNFENVIKNLTDDFRVAVVSYTGFDETGNEDFLSVLDEIQKIETYVAEHYGNAILAAYGCSLGGTFVTHLAAKHKIHMKYGIIGSSDMDQSGKIKAELMSRLMVKATYNLIHTGSYKSKIMQKRYKNKMESPGPYNKAFVLIVGCDNYDMSFITKRSIKNQFKSDLTTPLPLNIDNGETEIHVFYAKKMREKYFNRYKKYFKNPTIHTHDLRHEESLGVYPDKWAALLKEICLR